MPTERVLVIEGEVEVRRSLARDLSTRGYEVVACNDGVSAIHELEHSHKVDKHFNYVIADVFLRDISGLKILKVLKMDYPDLPVVVLSSYAEGALREQALDYSNTGYLDKPFELDDLVAELKRLTPGKTVEMPEHVEAAAKRPPRNAKAFIGIRITDPARADTAFATLRELQGVQRVDAVRGEMDIMVIGFRESREELDDLIEEIKQIEGIQITVQNHVMPAKLDADVSHFIWDYNTALEKTHEDKHPPEGPFAYLHVDVDPAEVQSVFTTVYFFDQVIECEMTDGGTNILAIACEANDPAYLRRVKQLEELDGVLRVREAMVFDLFDE